MSTLAVRRAIPADATALAEVHVASFKAAHRGLLPLNDATIARREAAGSGILAAAPSDGFTLVAERGSRPVGFCHVATPSRDADAGSVTAELTSIYVAPERWRNGFGTALLSSAISELLASGWRELTLWVLGANDRARSFYAAFGFELDGAEKMHEPSGRREVRLRLRC